MTCYTEISTISPLPASLNRAVKSPARVPSQEARSRQLEPHDVTSYPALGFSVFIAFIDTFLTNSRNVPMHVTKIRSNLPLTLFFFQATH